MTDISSNSNSQSSVVDERDILVTGPTFAFLLFDSVGTTPSISEGLIFGTREIEEIHRTTDEAQEQLVRREIVKLKRVVPTGRSHSFYSRSYVVDERKLAALCPSGEPLLGWFRFRRGYSSSTPNHLLRAVSASLREICPTVLLTLQLRQVESDINDVVYQPYLITEQNQLTPAILQIANVGDTSDDQRYWAASGPKCMQEAGTTQQRVREGFVNELEEQTRGVLAGAIEELKAAADSIAPQSPPARRTLTPVSIGFTLPSTSSEPGESATAQESDLDEDELEQELQGNGQIDDNPMPPGEESRGQKRGKELSSSSASEETLEPPSLAEGSIPSAKQPVKKASRGGGRGGATKLRVIGGGGRGRGILEEAAAAALPAPGGLFDETTSPRGAGRGRTRASSGRAAT